MTTLTKKMAEDLTDYLTEQGIKVKYMHHEVDTFERMEIIKDLRLGSIDVVVGINLLREGLDLPEVSLVAILDADKEGFLRSETSLIQTIGRAARNSEGLVIMYADVVTDSMDRAITETERRRAIQMAYNKAVSYTHLFLASNTISDEYYPELAGILFQLAVRLPKATGVHIGYINLSGGVGIPYRPEPVSYTHLAI